MGRTTTKNPSLKIKISIQITKEGEENTINLTGLSGFNFSQAEKIPPFGSGTKEIPIYGNGRIYLKIIQNYEGHFFVDICHRNEGGLCPDYWSKTITKNDCRRYIITIDPLKMIDELNKALSVSARAHAERIRGLHERYDCGTF